MAYGMQIKDANNNVTLDTNSTMLRYHDSYTIPAFSTGTFSSPDFNNADGFFVPTFRVNKYDYSNSVLKNDGSAWGTFIISTAAAHSLPDLSWNDTTDVMTYTENVLPTLWLTHPNSWSTDVGMRFYIYKGGELEIGTDYGAEFLNSDGLSQISFNDTMYKKGSGLTDKTYFTPTVARSLLSSTVAGVQPKDSNSTHVDSIGQIAAAGYNVETHSGIDIKVPSSVWNSTDLVFYQLSSPITYSATYNHAYPELSFVGTIPVVATDNYQRLNFKVASTNTNTFSPTETMGMQLLDASGNVQFDSRHPTIQIVKTFIITETQMSDCILNNTLIDLTLPYAVSDPWICCPYWVSFRANTINQVTRPKIWKLNDTTLRIQRNGGTGGSMFRQAFQAAWVIVAKL